jgi:two-component system phosphate regulon sensor histidine kinase PhoR
MTVLKNNKTKSIYVRDFKKYIIPILALILAQIILLCLLPLHLGLLFTLIFFIVLSDTAFVFFFASKRISEIEKIKDVIGSIRKREFSLSEEITLGDELLELQEEIKKMYSQTKQDIEYLKRLEQVRTEFLGNVSHELRTPIFAIQGYLETLLDGAIDDPHVNRNFLAKANHHVQNLISLLNDLIDISMIESGEMNLSFRYFRLSDLLHEIYQDMKYQAEEKYILFIMPQLDYDLQVYGDKSKIRQVLVNLIQNAIKYTEKGCVEIITKKENEASIKITVKDTGIGISEKDMPRIFERFYRVDKDRSRQAGGTGLGLAIVKHIVEAHNSKVEVLSEVGKGSEFSFSLKI